MTAWTFLLRSAGRVSGAALICPEARYCSIRWSHETRIDRRFLPAKAWKDLELELQSLPSGPLPARSAIAAALRHHDLSVSVAYVSAAPVDVAAPGDTVTVLDAALTRQALA